MLSWKSWLPLAALLGLSLLALACDPVAAPGVGGGLLGLVILVLDIWAIIRVIGSAASTGAKVLWVILILILPLIGLILWFFLGPK